MFLTLLHATEVSPPGPIVYLNRMEFRDSLLSYFRQTWLSNEASKFVDLFYSDSKVNRPTSDRTPFCRVTVQHGVTVQNSLSGSRELKIYRNNGILTAQLFTLVGDGLSKSDQITKVVQDAFEGQAVNGIWFRNVRVNEIGMDGDRYQTNILVDFSYDETL